MGNQQLLYIVLGFALVSFAVLAGLNYFQTQAVQSNRDQVILDLNNLANLAQTYYKKNSQLGGGNRSFTGFGISEDLKETEAGNYKLINVTSTHVTIEGEGKEYSETGAGCSESLEKVTYQISITSDETRLRKIY